MPKPHNIQTMCLGTMEPTYAVPDIENRTTATETSDCLKNEATLFPWQLLVIGHFHIEEGVHDWTLPHRGGRGRSSGWGSGTSPPPPSITIHANMELDMTTTEQQGVATTPLQITKLHAINLASTLSHPEAINAELDKEEVRAGRVLGPFPLLPLVNLRTSGLGVVPKENGKWRVILHLSAPEGHSVNDFISREEFTLHYSTIHHAVALLGRLNRGALMAT
ncbi:hypothetical protein EMCRGX_G001915 [Ephydatia muelleri]